jgi:argininosuccinate lyase
MAFDPTYIRLVLNQNFEDAKARLLTPLMAIHYAHLVMLVEQGIVERADGVAIRDALGAVSIADVQRATYDGSCEDLFFSSSGSSCRRVERTRPTAARDPRRHRRRCADATAEMILGCSTGGFARHPRPRQPASETVFAPHTHTQPAGLAVAHYVMAVSSSSNAMPSGFRRRTRPRTGTRSARAPLQAPGFQ